jgi:(p)ppGpp synthase/HD superfamily hydrolase
MDSSSSTTITPRFDDALAFAVDLHRDQRRKGSGIPYVAHLLSVAALVLEAGGDEDEAIAALLHDAVEDCPERVTLRQIGERFGERVARMVAGCTDTPEDYAGGPKAPWLARKGTYLQHLRAGPPSTRISLADKLHNARSILAFYRVDGEDLWARFSATREQTLWYYRSLVDAFRAAGQDGPMLGELDRVVTEIETLARTSSDRNH